jgi:disulfide bond formation protein DsbB
MRFTPSAVLATLVLISLAALAFVLVGQYAFGLHPCHLCVYQRWPFAAAIALGLLGALRPKFARPALLASAVAFFANAALAVYHSGVERKYWAGLSGCSTPDMSGSIDELMARIQNAAVVSCDEAGPQIFGLTLANYNALLCLGCGIAALACLFVSRRTSAQASSNSLSQ